MSLLKRDSTVLTNNNTTTNNVVNEIPLEVQLKVEPLPIHLSNHNNKEDNPPKIFSVELQRSTESATFNVPNI